MKASAAEGPARSAIAEAVRKNKPEPMIAQIPSMTKLTGPRDRLRQCSPTSCDSVISRSNGFFANKPAMRCVLLR